jgi:transcriptional regulator
MKSRVKTKDPVVPEERYETIRHRIIGLLKERPYGGKELSGYLRVPESDVYDHLEHIRKTINKRDIKLVVTPAHCDKCGFVFNKRERLKRPGRCPMCRCESPEEPLFFIE